MTGGQIAFEAYNKSTGGKTFDGREIPTWDEVKESKPHVCTAWEDAAMAVLIADGRILSDADHVELVGASLTSGVALREPTVTDAAREAKENRRLWQRTTSNRNHSNAIGRRCGRG